MDRANGLPRYRVGEIAIIKSESMAEFMGDYFDEGIIGVHSRVDCDVHRGKATTKKFCILEVRYTSCETDETRRALGRGRKGSVRHKYVSPCSATVKGKRRIAIKCRI